MIYLISALVYTWIVGILLSIRINAYSKRIELLEKVVYKND